MCKLDMLSGELFIGPLNLNHEEPHPGLSLVLDWDNVVGDGEPPIDFFPALEASGVLRKTQW